MVFTWYDVLLSICVQLKRFVVFKFYFSPDLPENEATFAIMKGGIADAKD